MALKIRLRRMGRKKAPTYRIVVAESLMPRDGRFVANLGHYNPRTEPVTLVVNREQALYWIGKGAIPTDTVQSLLRTAGVFQPEPSAADSAVEAVKSTAGKAAKAAAGAAGKVAAAARSAAAEVVEAVQDAAEAVAERVAPERDEAPEADPAAPSVEVDAAEPAPAEEEPRAE